MTIVQEIKFSPFCYHAGETRSEYINLFWKEIELMKRVCSTGNNHIVQIIGCILAEPPIAMVMEYVPFGDLHNNLLQWKHQVYILDHSIP